MTPESFRRWLSDMRAAGLAKSDAECARLLGYPEKNITRQKTGGGDKRLALACAALLSGLSPYDDSPA